MGQNKTVEWEVLRVFSTIFLTGLYYPMEESVCHFGKQVIDS